MTTFPTLNNVQTLGEFKQVFRWDINFEAVMDKMPDWKTDTGTPIANTITDFAKFNLSCQSAEEPKKDIEYALAELRGVKINQAGIGTVNGEIPFTFLDTMDNMVMDVFDIWMNAAYNTSKSGAEAVTMDAKQWGGALSQGATAAMPDYKVNGIKIYRLNGRMKRVYGIELVGASPRSFTRGGTLESRSSEISKPQITLVFDGWFRIAVPAIT